MKYLGRGHKPLVQQHARGQRVDVDSLPWVEVSSSVDYKNCKLPGLVAHASNPSTLETAARNHEFEAPKSSSSWREGVSKTQIGRIKLYPSTPGAGCLAGVSCLTLGVWMPS